MIPKDPRLPDHRYRVNIEPGLRVMLSEDSTTLIPCYVKQILTEDPMNELGIKVECENGKIGRVKYIGTEAEFMDSADLIPILEKKLRNLIASELSQNDPKWWENKIPPKIQEQVKEAKKIGITSKKLLDIPDYDHIQELYFSDLSLILLTKKNWKNNFEKIFHDAHTLRIKLSELSICRNLVSHAKPLTLSVARKIQVYYVDIIQLIESYERSRTSEEDKENDN